MRVICRFAFSFPKFIYLFIMRMLQNSMFVVVIVLNVFRSMCGTNMSLEVSMDWRVVDDLWPSPSPTSMTAAMMTSGMSTVTIPMMTWVTILRTTKVATSSSSLVIA